MSEILSKNSFFTGQLSKLELIVSFLVVPEKIAKLKHAKEEAQREAAAHRELMEFELQKKTIEVTIIP